MPSLRETLRGPARGSKEFVLCYRRLRLLDPKGQSIVSCSRLSCWKRIDRMLRAVAVARDAGCDCQLLVAGDGPEKQRLAGLAEELGVAPDVVWLGAVAHEEIWALMHVANVFMITNDVTNRCNPLYEAICAGLPSVSVRHGSAADLLKDGQNALLAEAGDAERLGQCMHRILCDGQLAGRLRAEQKRRAEALWTCEERMAA